MYVTLSRTARQKVRKTCRSLPMICLAATLMIAAGCASVPAYRTHPDLAQRKSAIKTVGLLPPLLKMYEEQYRFGLNNIVPHDDWSREAAEAIQKAFLGETAVMRMPLTVIKEDEGEVGDILNLFSVVDFSIQRHVYDTFAKEPFPEKARSFDYFLGPARETMERYHVDAVWIVTGFNLVPTTGAQVGDAVATFLGILGAMGGGPGPLLLKKFELRAALVDKNGDILFYIKLDDSNVQQSERQAGQFDVLKGGPDLAPAGPRADIRDPRYVKRYIRALLAEYRTVAAQ